MYLQCGVADVWAGVKGELAEAGQQWKPKVHVLVLVAELQPLSTAPALALRAAR